MAKYRLADIRWDRMRAVADCFEEGVACTGRWFKRCCSAWFYLSCRDARSWMKVTDSSSDHSWSSWRQQDRPAPQPSKPIPGRTRAFSQCLNEPESNAIGSSVTGKGDHYIVDAVMHQKCSTALTTPACCTEEGCSRKRADRYRIFGSEFWSA